MVIDVIILEERAGSICMWNMYVTHTVLICIKWFNLIGIGIVIGIVLFF